MLAIVRSSIFLSIFLKSFVVHAIVEPPGALISYVSPDSSQHADILLTPASTLKVVTATAALKRLGKDYRYSTSLSVKPSPQGMHIRLHMRGDPSFTSQDLVTLLSKAKAQLGSKVASVQVDDGEFTGHSRSQGQVWNDIGICFAAPSSSLNIDNNCINGNLKPGKVGQLSRLHVSDSGLINIDNQIVTVSPSHPRCEQNLLVGEHNQYSLQGCIKADRSMMPLRFSINDEHRYFSTKLKRGLARAGLSYKGSIAYQQQLSLYPERFNHQSAPLLDLLEYMLVESDNLTADSIFKTLAREQQRAGTFQQASEVVVEELSALGLDLSRAQIRDGSGLSRENLISANLLYQVMLVWQSDPQLQPLIERLPLAGETGTLKYRRSVTRAPLKKQIRAKSGYVNGVINLVGFIEKSGQLRPFVLMVNGVSLNEAEATAVRKRQTLHPVLRYEKEWLEQQWQMLN
jgi:D-alanyl-D-alanine carboxypeptidase/D-alanyl-D-alanine-endopeptidase (penicillin-binding protein 4)